MRPVSRVAVAVLVLALLPGLGRAFSKQTSNSPFGGTKAPDKAVAAGAVRRHASPPKTVEASRTVAGGESASLGAACQTVTTCFQHIAAGRPYHAVDDCFTAPGFAQRMPRDKYDRLDVGQREYIVQLSSVMFKSLV